MRSPEPPSLDAAALDTVPVAVIDLEMTGLDPEHDRIIEIGVVRAIGGAVERVYETLVRPGSLPFLDAAGIATARSALSWPRLAKRLPIS